MTLVLDASVALKLVYREAGSPEALALLGREDERVAPVWMLAEVANGLANKSRFEGAPLESMQQALRVLPAYIDRLVPVEPLLHESMKLATELGHALYDCLYLVIALDESARLVTADDSFVTAARRAGYADSVERLRW